MSVAPKYRYWLVGALILGIGAATPYAQDAARALANTFVTSRAAGTAHPLDVMVVDENGDPAALAATITGDVTIDTSALETLNGALTETAPASDTASSGLNGRLQRIAQRLTSLIAKLPALGTAGTSSTDVISVQGIASGTALPVSVASLPSHAVTNAGTFATQAAQSGTWNVTNISGTITLPTGAATSENQTTGNTSLASLDDKFPSATTMADNTTNPAVPGFAAFNYVFDGTTWDRARATADSTSDSAAEASGPQVFALASAAAPTAMSTDGDAVRVWADLNGRLQASPSATASTDSGALTCSFPSDGTTVAKNCKTSAGNIYDLSVVNTTATLYYLRLYNLAAAPTCSSATGFIESIPIPTNSTSGAGIAKSFPVGRSYTTGIGFCLTTTGASTGNTAAASGVYVSIGYK